MIDISESLVARIREEAVHGYPNEICGALLGQFPDDPAQAPITVSDVVAIENTREAAEQYHRFRIEPLDYLRVERRAAERGHDVVGFYHSHPDHPAIPSDYDRDHALPGLSYIVIQVLGDGLDAPHAPWVTSWTLASDRSEFVHEAELRVPDDAHPTPATILTAHKEK